MQFDNLKANFKDRADLLDAQTVIRDAKSENDALRECAFRALEYIRDERVHGFALYYKEKREEDAIYLLAWTVYGGTRSVRKKRRQSSAEGAAALHV